MLDAGEQRVVDVVAKHGWMVQKVFANEDGPQEWFAYTIGLPLTIGWPELICFGLDLDQMHRMLNNAVEECRDRALFPNDGLQLAEVLEGFNTRLLNAGPWHWKYTGWAQWFAAHSEVPKEKFDCLQLVWPDKRGRFPSDPDCNEEIRRLQIPLELDS